MKIAIIVLSDPHHGEQEALGRVFNALAAAYDFKNAGDDVQILFHGTATRWPGKLLEESHPANALYKAVQDTVAGVSCGCADVFGTNEEAEKLGLELITDNAVPGTSGLPSFRKLLADGYEIITF
ncbi:DsrE family protein [bacterium]|nr:DsrE family protein [bacterium]